MAVSRQRLIVARLSKDIRGCFTVASSPSLLDGAMTNCLFAHGQQGITGELKVRFRHPVVINRMAIVRAWIDRSTPPFHVLQAELIQDEWLKAKATGKFVQRSHLEAKGRQE